MSAPSSYAAALRTPGASKFYLAAAPARIGIAMTGLGIVWLVHGSTGSYAAAGTVTGGFAVAEAVAGPQVARLIDRFGQTRMLPSIVFAHALSVGLLIGLTVTGAPLATLVAAGVLAGGSLPQIGAQTAARWSHALREAPPLLSSAFALESFSIGVAFMIGPVLVGTVSSLVNPMAGLVLATTSVLTGGLLLAAQRSTAPSPSRHEHRSAKGLLHKRFAALVGTNVGVGLFFGSMQVSVTAFAVANGAPGLAGPLYSVTSLVSLFVGLAYGARRWQTAQETQFVIAFIWLTVSCLPLIVVHTPLAAAVALALPGLAIAPFQTLSAVLTESAVNTAVLTQAFTWLNSGGAAGIALGSAFAGWVVDGHSTQYGFGVALTAALTATLMATMVKLSGR